MQHVVLRATGYERTAQLLSLTEFKSHLFQLYFIGSTINRLRKGGNRSTWKTNPGDELQKMQHTKTRRFQPQARIEPAQQHWWQARKAHVLTITTRLIVSLAEVINRRKPGCREKNPVRRAPENAVHLKLSVCTGPTL